MTLPADIDSKKERAALWFRQVRDDLVARLEAIETDVTGPHADRPAGRFEHEARVIGEPVGHEPSGGRTITCRQE
jgi:coproporphyrinogen III oxidase